MNLSISEQLCYCTVRIECKNDIGQTSTGTGFFFSFKISDNETIPIVVTNKHVVNGMTVGQFLMTTSDQNGAPVNTNHFSVTLPNLQTFIRLTSPRKTGPFKNRVSSKKIIYLQKFRAYETTKNY